MYTDGIAEYVAWNNIYTDGLHIVLGMDQIVNFNTANSILTLACFLTIPTSGIIKISESEYFFEYHLVNCGHKKMNQ